MKHVLSALIVCLFTPSVFASDQAEELTYLEPVVAPDLMPYASFQIPARENIWITNEAGQDYLELKMFPGQQHTNKGNRAEIAIDFPHVEGQTVIYEWQMRIPAASQTDFPDNRWWVLAQWHDQPDPRLGQTWDNYPLYSPPVSLGYGVIDGQDMISFTYGAPEQQGIALAPLSRNEWHHIRAVIHWSTQQRGSAHVYLDDMHTPFGSATGRNMYNSFQHFIKLGTYRHPQIQVASQIHIDNIRIQIQSN